MSEQEWYVYQQSQQLGPFAHPQLKQLFDTSMVSNDAYIFRVGWKDWRPIEECHGELGLGSESSPEIPLSSAPEDRRSGAPRATIRGRVIVHNNGQLVIGGGVNISATGIFVETPDPIFKVGEKLKLTCRVEGILRAFNVTAKVVRYNGDNRFAVGYGLQFESLDQSVALGIQKLIDQVNLSLAT